VRHERDVLARGGSTHDDVRRIIARHQHLISVISVTRGAPRPLPIAAVLLERAPPDWAPSGEAAAIESASVETIPQRCSARDVASRPPRVPFVAGSRGRSGGIASRWEGECPRFRNFGARCATCSSGPARVDANEGPNLDLQRTCPELLR
jgi:hypothetical protein